MNGPQPSLHKPAAGRFELPARAASAVVMGLAAVGAVFTGGLVFADDRRGRRHRRLARVAPAHQWRAHRARDDPDQPRDDRRGVADRSDRRPAACAGGDRLGAFCAALSAAIRSLTVLWPIPWHAFGALYLGLPVVSLAAASRRSAGERDRRRLVRGGLDRGYGRAPAWPADRRTEARARTLAQQDLGGVCRRARWLPALAEAIYVFSLGGAALEGTAVRNYYCFVRALRRSFQVLG